MANYIVSSEEGTLQLNQNDPNLSVLQNIALILKTKRGTVPLDRDFGLEMQFIDKPIDIAETIAYTEVTEAVEEYEPRASVTDVSFSTGADGKMILNVEVEIEDEP